MDWESVRLIRQKLNGGRTDEEEPEHSLSSEEEDLSAPVGTVGRPRNNTFQKAAARASVAKREAERALEKLKRKGTPSPAKKKPPPPPPGAKMGENRRRSTNMGRILLNGTEMKMSTETRYLGVILDYRPVLVITHS